VQPIVDGHKFQMVRKEVFLGSSSNPAVSSVNFLRIQRAHDSFPSTLESSSYSTSGEPAGSDDERGGAFASKRNSEMLLKLMAEPQGFQALVLHLSNELALETILFVVEVTQFQNYLKQRCHYDLVSRSGRSVSDGIVLPADIPESEIVFGDDSKDNLVEEHEDDKANDIELLYAAKLKAVKLFRKYVAPHAELEVNLWFHCRRQLVRRMGDPQAINKWLAHNSNVAVQFRRLLELFEEPITEIFALIIDSFNRFKHTARYSQLKRFRSRIFD